MRLAALFAFSLLTQESAKAQVIFKALAPSGTPVSAEAVQALEQKVVMPADAAPLTSYDRYYAPGVFEKKDVIVGVYLKRPARVREGATPVPGFLSAYTTTVDKLPRIPGGACNVVTLYFDVVAGHFLRLPSKGREPQTAVCNGLS